MIKLRKSKINWVSYPVAIVAFIFYVSDYFNLKDAVPYNQTVLEKANSSRPDKITRQKTETNVTENYEERASKQLHYEQTVQFQNRIPLLSLPSNESFGIVNSSFSLDLEEDEDLVDLLDGEYEETIAFAFGIGLELDFFYAEEELEDESNNETNRFAAELTSTEIADFPNTDFGANQAVLDTVDKILSSDSSFEVCLEHIKQLTSLTPQLSESEALIIMTLNDLTEDADILISEAAFEGLEALIAKQQKESVPDFEMENHLSGEEFDYTL